MPWNSHRTSGNRRFFLVQRIEHSPHAEAVASPIYKNMKVAANPFGGGRMGDYELDYMGAAEFEFRATTESNNRLSAGTPVLEEHEYEGHRLLFLFTEEDGDPFEEWVEWAKGKPADATTRARLPFDGKAPAYDLKNRLAGESEPSRTVVWWALDEDVMWSFIEEDGSCHLTKMLESMKTEPTKFLK